MGDTFHNLPFWKENMAKLFKKDNKDIIEITKDELKAFAEKHAKVVSEERDKLQADNARMAAEIEAAALEKELNMSNPENNTENPLDTLYESTFGKGK